jgi:short-subunit dehydrogenase
MLFGEICTHRMETGLQNRVAIVAASSKEIGRATVRAAEGTKLALCARNGDLLSQVAEEARNLHGVEVYTDTLDVAEE